MRSETGADAWVAWGILPAELAGKMPPHLIIRNQRD